MFADLKCVCSLEYLQLLHALKADSELSQWDCVLGIFEKSFLFLLLSLSQLLTALLRHWNGSFYLTRSLRWKSLISVSVSPVVVTYSGISEA